MHYQLQQPQQAKYDLKITFLTFKKFFYSLFNHENKAQNKFMAWDCKIFDSTTKFINIYRFQASLVTFKNGEQKNVQYVPNKYEIIAKINVVCVGSTYFLEYDDNPVSMLGRYKYPDKPLSLEEQQTQNNKQKLIKLLSNHYPDEPFHIVGYVDHKSEPKNGKKIRLGSTIKIGTVQFFVRELKKNGVLKTIQPPKSFTLKRKSFRQNNQQQSQCKICFDSQQTQSNILINPCKCKGSCGAIHSDCLKQWNKMRTQSKKKYKVESWANKCEICQCSIPIIYQCKNGKKLQLFQMKNIKRPIYSDYIMLECIYEYSPSLYIIHESSFTEIIIGRSQQCDIKIQNLLQNHYSVSPEHAIIKMINNDFYLFDCGSKYGTLIRYEKVAYQQTQQKKHVQVGRTIITTSLIENYHYKNMEKKKQTDKYV